MPPLRVPLTQAQRDALGKQKPPSKASLREMPPVDFSRGLVGRGPEGLREAIAQARAKRGRPKKGETPAGSSPRSVRLPDADWAALERLAEQRRISVHALLREAIAEKLRKTG